MKNKVLITIGAMLAAGLYFHPVSSTNGNGAPSGKTGAPGESTCTQCHSGTAQPFQNMFSTNIPNNQYVPGETYDITVKAVEVGRSEFGYEAVAVFPNGSKAGSLTAGTGSKLIGGGMYITQSTPKTDPDSTSWTFQWTAPAAGSGDVGFYAAVNCSNNNNGITGDLIYTGSLMLTEGMSVSIASMEQEPAFLVYPIPAQERLHVNLSNDAQKGEIQLWDLNGKLMFQKKIMGSTSAVLEVNHLARGQYLLQIVQDGQGVYHQSVILD